MHQYHTQSNVAQHEVVTLTTYIANLNLTDSLEGTIRQFLSHFKEKIRLLDSLVPDTDKIPQTVRITFLQKAVQQTHDLRQIHVLDFIWRSKTGSTGKLTLEVYYDLLCNATYQHDLNKSTGQQQRQAFILHQVINSDESDHEFGEDNLRKMIHLQIQLFNPPSTLLSPRKPTKVFIPYQHLGRFPRGSQYDDY